MKDVPWEDIFKLRALAAASEFCGWVRFEIDVYIPRHNSQVKLYSSPWLSAPFAAAIVHRNHMFCLYQQNKSSEFKVKFRQASDHCKRVFEAVKLVYTSKTKEFITSQNHVSRDFSELQIVFSAKVNLLYLLHSTAEKCCLLHLIKQSYLLKTFLTTLILMTWVSLCLFPLLELI